MGKIVAGLCGLIVLATVVVGWVWHRHTKIAEYQAWMVTGAACPVISKADYEASGTVAGHIFEYDGARLARAYGYVNCDEVASDGGKGMGTIPVCQFNSPTMLRVTTKRGEVFYSTRTSPATVSFKDDQPSCVLNATPGLQ